MLKFNIRGDFTAEHFEVEVMCLESAVQQLIASLEPTKIDAAFVG